MRWSWIWYKYFLICNCTCCTRKNKNLYIFMLNQTSVPSTLAYIHDHYPHCKGMYIYNTTWIGIRNENKKDAGMLRALKINESFINLFFKCTPCPCPCSILYGGCIHPYILFTPKHNSKYVTFNNNLKVSKSQQWFCSGFFS